MDVPTIVRQSRHCEVGRPQVRFEVWSRYLVRRIDGRRVGASPSPSLQIRGRFRALRPAATRVPCSTSAATSTSTADAAPALPARRGRARVADRPVRRRAGGRRAHGLPGVGMGHAPLAARAQRGGRAAGVGLRDCPRDFLSAGQRAPRAGVAGADVEQGPRGVGRVLGDVRGNSRKRWSGRPPPTASQCANRKRAWCAFRAKEERPLDNTSVLEKRPSLILIVEPSFRTPPAPRP